jgi:hypothetical protein
MEPGRFLFDEDALPGSWYNVVQVISSTSAGTGTSTSPPSSSTSPAPSWTANT